MVDSTPTDLQEGWRTTRKKHFKVSAIPIAEWVQQQLRETFSADELHDSSL